MDDNANKDQPLTISAPPAPTVTVDPQNPLPEPSFFWRRVIACAVTAFACTLAWITAGHLFALGDAERLYSLTKLVIIGAGLVLTYYFVAPSAAELTSMIQTAKLQRHAVEAAMSAQNKAIPDDPRWRQARSQQSVGPHSGIPEEPLSDAYSRPGGDLTDLDQDCAPRGRQ